MSIIIVLYIIRQFYIIHNIDNLLPIYIHVSVLPNLKRISFINYRILKLLCIYFFKKKFNCFDALAKHTYMFFMYVYDTSQVQMSPQTFCRGNNWIYVCAFDAALIFTTFMHNVYKICGTFPLFHVCCSPIVSKVSKQKSIFFSKFQENWSFRDTGAKWTKI